MMLDATRPAQAASVRSEEEAKQSLAVTSRLEQHTA